MDEFIQELKAFSFTGRLNRMRYWKYTGFLFLLNFAIAFVLNLLKLGGGIANVINLALAIVALPFSVRRVHDLNRSGWWLLITIIPIINFLFCIYVGFFKGTDGDNDYGADPLVDYEAAREGRKAGGSRPPVAPIQAPKPPVQDVKPQRPVEDVKPAASAEAPKPPVPPVVPAAAPEAPKPSVAPAAVPEAPKPASKPAFCPNCGAPLEGAGKFCGSCGSKV